jgi:membrane protease YdiL (CAAX protease family)
MFYLVLAVIGAWIFVANQARIREGQFWQQATQVGAFSSMSMQLFLVVSITWQALNPPEEGVVIALSGAIVFAIYGGTLAMGAILFGTQLALRERLQNWLTDRERTFNAHDPVHLVAGLLMFLVMAYIPATYLLAGGLEGVADMIAQSANDGRILVQVQDMLVFVLVALLGVGTAIRRDWRQSWQRLGVRIPTHNDWRWGIGSGILLFFMLIPISGFLSALFTPEALAQQQVASEQILLTYGTSLGLGLLLAITAGIGEEILFRGALQPVFGIGITTLFFTMVHLQYTLTPASLIIFGVALAFAFLRERLSTTAAIIAHIVYNAMPFVMLALFNSMV